MTLHAPPVKGWQLPALPAATRDAYTLSFGRHKGRRLDQVGESYLLWLGDFSPSPTLRLMARKQLGLDVVLDEEEEPRADLAAIVLPGVVFRWWCAMDDEFRDDPAARVVVDRGLAKLKSLCSEFTRKDWPAEPEGGGV